MQRRRHLRRCQTGILLATIILASVGVPGRLHAQGSSERPPGRLERADAATIRTEVRNILSEPRFAPRRTFLQWLADKLSGWKGPSLGLPKSLTTVLFYIFLVWCVLTLLAILAHLVWTVVVTVKGSAKGSGMSWRRADTASEGEATYDELCREMRRLAEQGLFRRATGVMMRALLCWLDRVEAVTFHHSKTNGDYVREYTRELPQRDGFRRFAVGFDVLVYGNAPCEAATYERMKTLFEQVQGDVR